MKKNLLISIGCSWTSGEGGWTKEFTEKYCKQRNDLPNEMVDMVDKMEYQNSWPCILANSLLPNFDVINLGARGIGNKAAVKYLTLCGNHHIRENLNRKKYDKVIVIFMLSGSERFDYVDKENLDTFPVFRTLWPNDLNKQFKMYAKHLYSDKFACWETFLAVLEAQTYCKANNLEFIFCNSFQEYSKDIFMEYIGDYVRLIDWNRFVHEDTDYSCFIEKLIILDNILPNWNDYQGIYSNRHLPTTHITPCIHPTKAGYNVIANELYSWIQRKNII